MRTLFSFILMLLCLQVLAYPGNDKPVYGGSPNSLKGKVIDSTTDEAVAGALVYIHDLDRSMITDSSGQFHFSDLPTGRFLVEIRALNYSSHTQKININGDISINFKLENTGLENVTVIFTGASHATEIKKSPVPIISIDKSYLQQTLGTNLVDAIAKVPGVNAVTTGPNVSKPFIRGLGYNRILTLYDGVRQEGQQWGDEHGVEIDQYSIDHVEVVKGPASLTHGSDALAGVVNFLPPAILPYGKIAGNVLAEYQSNNGMIGTSAMIMGNTNGYTWSGRISHKEATNYQNKIDGQVYGTAFKETDASAGMGINRSWGYSRLNLTMYDDIQEIPDGSRDSASRKFTKQINEADTLRPVVSKSELNSYKITVLHQHVQHYRALWTNSVHIGKGKIAFNAGYQQSIRREYSHPENADIPGLYLNLKTLNYDIKYYIPEILGWEPMVGINGMYQINQNKGTEFIIPDYKLFDLGPFAFIKKSYKKLDISGGVRYDIRSFSNTGLYTKPNPVTGFDEKVSNNDTVGASHPFSDYKHSFSGMSGSIGATYSINKKVNLKANLARGFRAPNIAELSANGVHPGTNIYQLGNPDFKPEQNIQEDLGLFVTTRHVSISVEAFNNDISNYIYNQKLLNKKGQDSIIIDGNQTFQFQSAHAQLYGGEFNIDIHPHPYDWLHFENSLSMVYALNKEVGGVKPAGDARYLPFIPPVHTRHELRAGFNKPFKHVNNAFVKVEVELYAAQNRAYLAYNTETTTPGYALLNAGIGGDIVNKKGNTIITITILGNNLGDVAYQSHLSRLKYFEAYPNDPRPYHGIYNMGRDISFKVIIPFTFKTSKPETNKMIEIM